VIVFVDDVIAAAYMSGRKGRIYRRDIIINIKNVNFFCWQLLPKARKFTDLPPTPN
jgi:hypothetical protein